MVGGELLGDLSALVYHCHIRAALYVRVDQLCKIEGGSNVAVADNNIFFTLLGQKAQNAVQRFHAAVIYLRAGLREGRHDVQAAALAHQIPFAAGAKMIHQRMIVFLRDDGNVFDAGVHHAGERKINHTIAPAERHRRHGAVLHQLRNEIVVSVGEDDPERVDVYHSFSPSCTSFSSIALGPTEAFSPMVTPSPTTATPHLDLSSTVSGRAPTVAPFFTVTFSAMME